MLRQSNRSNNTYRQMSTMPNSSNRPNILFILTDQQRQDSLACYGNDWIETPNLNHIAARSHVFENAYVTQPVCTPSRASIMTGLYPHAVGLHRNNIPLPADCPTIAERISEDYYNAYFGKWHLGDDMIRQHGFDRWVSVEDLHRVRATKREYRNVEADYNDHLRKHGIEPPGVNKSYENWFATAGLTEEQTQASFLGDCAADFIRNHPDSESKDMPFMLYVSFFEPHPPYTGPLNDLYEPDEVTVGPAFLKRPDDSSLLNRLRAEYYMAGNLNPLGIDDYHDLTAEDGWRRLRAQYFANVTLVDRQVGKMLEALHESGQIDNTIIVFTSEHGEMAGDHGMLEKRSMYEEASRVPLLIRVPGSQPDRDGEANRIRGSVSLVDLVPTLLELSGTTSSEANSQSRLGDGFAPNDAASAGAGWQMQGKSLVSVMNGDHDLNDNDVFVQWNGMGDRNLGTPEINRMASMHWRTVITPDRWKLNLCPADQCELYDLNTDPHEMHNLYDDPQHQDRIRDMAARIRIWQSATGDDADLPRV